MWRQPANGERPILNGAVIDGRHDVCPLNRCRTRRRMSARMFHVKRAPRSQLTTDVAPSTMDQGWTKG